MRFTRVLATIVLAAGVLAACGGSGSSSVSLDGKRFEKETGRRAVTVEAVDNSFEPPYVTVSTGTRVTFVNKGRNRHNVISVGDGFESSGLLDPDDEFTVTFDDAGDYPYYCSLHGTASSGMTGGVRVVG